MTADEAKKQQDEISKHWTLGFWYGTNCEKCCGVYPKLMSTNGFDDKCYYQCEVCGKRTEAMQMPWLSRDAWNRHEYCYDDEQPSLF